MYVHACTCCGMLVEVIEQPVGVTVLLPPYGSLSSKRSQDWQEVPLPTEPSC